MDTSIRVIRVDVLWLNDSAGAGPARLAQSMLNSLEATRDDTYVLSTRSVVLWWRVGPRFIMWWRVVNANEPCACAIETSWERNQRASNGTIKQDIECGNTMMRCGMFKGSMYEYLMSFRWRFVRRIHGNEKHVVRGMLRSTRFDGWTVRNELEWRIRVA